MRSVILALVIVLSAPELLWAHGFAGKRFFPSTLTMDDPFVADELSLLIGHIKELGEGEDPPVESTVISGEYSKTITQHLGVTLGGDFRHLKLDMGETEDGFGNLDLGAKYQAFKNDLHEALLSVGMDIELGGTGSSSVGAESFSTLSPALFFGKGLGDLPEALKYLKPLAITGRVGPNFPTRNQNVTTQVNHQTGEIERHVEPNPVTLGWGLAIQYNFQYLQSFVQDVGLKAPLDRMIVLVEFPLETCLNRGCGGQTVGTANPGLIWFGRGLQLAIEAVIPINQRTGGNVGVLGLLHFYLDDLFPKSLGRPIFRQPG